MFENTDPNTLIAVIGLAITVAMQLVGFGKIIGQVNEKLSDHDKAHIRHQTRLDEHAAIISQHEKDIAVMKDRAERGDGNAVR